MKKFIRTVVILVILFFIVLNMSLSKVVAATTITRKSEETNEKLSSNANLSNLGIYTYDFKGFKPSITTYETTIPNNVTQVSVYATTQDKGATYKVIGDKNLQLGTNRVTIEVTAEDKKTTKEYYINVKRKSEVEVNKSGNLRIVSLTIDDEENNLKLEPNFKSEIYEYVINVEGDIETIPLKIAANQQDATEEIEGNEDLEDGENEITITVTSKDKKEQAQYKITVRKNMKELEAVENIQSANKYYSEEHIQYGWYIIGGILITFFIIFIIMLIVGRKNKTKKKMEG